MIAPIVSWQRRLRAVLQAVGLLTLGLLPIVLPLAATTGAADQQSPPLSPSPVTIHMTRHGFNPSSVHVLVGSKVIWENDDTRDITMLQRSDTGTVIVRVVVNAQGQVLNAYIAQSSGSDAIDDTVLKVAKNKTFSPADQGQPQSRAYLIEFNYGSPEVAASASPPQFGMVTIKAGGTFSYTFAASGEYYYFWAPDGDIGTTVLVSEGR